VPITAGSHARAFDHHNYILLRVSALKCAKFAVQVIKRNVDQLRHA
jgi:hypothetical protein